MNRSAEKVLDLILNSKEEFTLTDQEIANRIGVCQRTVKSAIKKLCDQGIVERKIIKYCCGNGWSNHRYISLCPEPEVIFGSEEPSYSKAFGRAVYSSESNGLADLYELKDPPPAIVPAKPPKRATSAANSVSLEEVQRMIKESQEITQRSFTTAIVDAQKEILRVFEESFREVNAKLELFQDQVKEYVNDLNDLILKGQDQVDEAGMDFLNAMEEKSKELKGKTLPMPPEGQEKLDPFPKLIKEPKGKKLPMPPGMDELEPAPEYKEKFLDDPQSVNPIDYSPMRHAQRTSRLGIPAQQR